MAHITLNTVVVVFMFLSFPSLPAHNPQANPNLNPACGYEPLSFQFFFMGFSIPLRDTSETCGWAIIRRIP